MQIYYTGFVSEPEASTSTGICHKISASTQNISSLRVDTPLFVMLYASVNSSCAHAPRANPRAVAFLFLDGKFLGVG